MNAEKTADLHIHTLASDGAYSAREVLNAARVAGLSAIAITDHDSVEALPEAISLAEEYGIEVIPGIEISVELDAAEMHLLGYFVDYRDPGFRERLALLRRVRACRAEAMLKILEEMGFPLDMEKLLPGQMTGAIGRLHIAQALFRSGYVQSLSEAFSRYIGNNGPAYVSKMKLSKEDALAMILRAGGVPVLAHPGQLDRDELIPDLIKLGLAGLEAYYPSHSRFTTNHYLELARHYHILATGGSDCHGTNKEKILIGTVRVPYRVVEELRERNKR
ncbi:MAG: PHP domain-containing protein [PVC group bacterium]